jgi:hypothetical protein
VTFAGAWTNYGFHEDGFTSGLKLAVDKFGAKIPFPVRPANRDIQKEPVARSVVSAVEMLRAFLVATPLWSLLTWIVLTMLNIMERALQSTGRKDWLYEVDSIRGFWQPGQRRGHLKKIQ